MRCLIGVLAVVVVGGLGLAGPAGAGHRHAGACPPDSVESGTICIDLYEASVWDLSGVPDDDRAGLVKKIRKGKVTEADLLAAGAVQRGVAGDDYYGAGCPDTGNGCVDFYAVSIPGVTPSASITWFQAAAAARNSGKRLTRCALVSSPAGGRRCCSPGRADENGNAFALRSTATASRAR